ncbi:MAG: hypothetical protein KME44_11105 [Candidatus Thiodiazotropha sp. (ex Lucina pensylvanica)]|nr:hypothetical protein [Candidatus Thiodiazotropha sp. (ex Lucina pensylvanica)]
MDKQGYINYEDMQGAYTVTKYYFYSLVLVCILCSSQVAAYDWKAHTRMARLAAQNSILTNNEFVDGMGFDKLANVQDEIDRYQCMKSLSIPGEYNHLLYIYCGAVYEDYAYIMYEPVIIRGLNHFYDPENDTPLIQLPIFYPDTVKAPDWALEDQFVTNNPILDLQQYSLQDATNYLLRGYTLATKNERTVELTKFFQSLGMVVHLVQDMGTPEHARVDQHLFGSFHERYTERIVKKLPLTTFAYNQIDLNDLNYARDLFKNRFYGDQSGLASFTNRNFISNDTNFIVLPDGSFTAGQDYALPRPNQTVEVADASLEFGNSALHGQVHFVSTNGNDGYGAKSGGPFTIFNQRASAFNLFSTDLNEVRKLVAAPRIFTINSKTVESANDFLLRRAVSFGTGLINYFFRGHFSIDDLSWVPGANSTSRDITLTISNTTSDYNAGSAPFAFSDGSFALYYDTINGDRIRVLDGNSMANYLSTTDILNDQDTKSMRFVIDDSAWDQSKPLLLIFDGKIGNERGIALKKFYPDPLLAFSVDGVQGESPVPNIITVSASYDLGYTWTYKGGFYKPVTDTTLFTGNRVLVHKAINLGEGELLVHFSYIDYMDDDGNIMAGRSENSMAHSTDYGQTWELVDFTWQPLLVGAALGSDTFSVYESIVYTGEQGLAGIRVQHPGEAGGPREFQLFQSNALGAPGSWLGAPGLGTGGLPEVDYLGNSSFGFAGYLEGNPPGRREGGDFPFDSIMMRTDDGGASYYQLTDFSSECGDHTDPNNKVTYCIQHFEYMGNERLLGWVDLRSESLADYHNGVALHLSTDGGMSWSPAMNAPFDLTCESLSVWEGRVDNVIPIGKSPGDKDVVLALTQCQEAYEDTSSSPPSVNWGPVTGKGLYFTRDGGGSWSKVSLPAGFNNESELLYTGDNGAVPGLYSPVN